MIKKIGGFVLGIYFILSLISLLLIQNTIEKTTRIEARQIANGIGQCINERINSSSTQLELSKISYECGAYHRSGGPTGDFFVIDLTTNKFIYDGSSDCSKEGYNRYLTYKEECSLHKNKELCLSVINTLKKGINSYDGQNLYWQFDDSVEWLEWVVIPSETRGIKDYIGFGGIKNKDNSQLLVVMGTQSDEINKQWLYVKIFFTLSLFIGIILAIFSYLIINYE